MKYMDVYYTKSLIKFAPNIFIIIYIYIYLLFNVVVQTVNASKDG